MSPSPSDIDASRRLYWAASEDYRAWLRGESDGDGVLFAARCFGVERLTVFAAMDAIEVAAREILGQAAAADRAAWGGGA